MKKTYSFLLIIFICFMIVGCQTKEDKANKIVQEANLLVESDDLELAITKYSEANNIFPKDEYQKLIYSLNMEILLKESSKLVENMRFNDAISLLKSNNQNFDYDDNIMEITYLHGKYFIDEKDFSSAISILEPISDYKDSNELLVKCADKIAISTYKKGDFEEAEKCFLLLKDKNYTQFYLDKIKLLKNLQGEWIETNDSSLGYIIKGWNLSHTTPLGWGFIDEEFSIINENQIYYKSSSQFGMITILGEGESLTREAWNSTRKYIKGELKPKIEPKIGMTAKEVEQSIWGTPSKINKTTTKYGIDEQWVYSLNKYIYFENGIVTSIQE